jgi:hypothetical protein
MQLSDRGFCDQWRWVPHSPRSGRAGLVMTVTNTSRPAPESFATTRARAAVTDLGLVPREE